jgi:methionyl-tRNA formyltransferase
MALLGTDINKLLFLLQGDLIYLFQMSDKKIKVVFFGTPEFALPSLAALELDDSFEISAVITQEDKPVGRKQVMSPPPVKEFALSKNLPVLQPKRLKNNNEILDVISGLKPDFLVVVAYGKILPPEILKIPKFCCINLHGSLLPKYRGASPVEEALLNGDKETGITFIRMDSGLDGGDIFLIQRAAIAPDDDSTSLRAKLSLLGGKQLPYLLKDIADGLIEPIPQNNSKATFCHKIKKEDGLLDLKKMSATEILNRIKAYTPWPSCYLIYKGKKIKILKAAADETSSAALKCSPEEIVTIENNSGMGIGTIHGLLIPKTVQLEGKKPLPIQDFLRGNSGFFK